MHIAKIDFIVSFLQIRSLFTDIRAEVLYDVLHDPDFRKTWDLTMTEGYEICSIDPNNDIGYYASKNVPKLLSAIYQELLSFYNTMSVSVPSRCSGASSSLITYSRADYPNNFQRSEPVCSYEKKLFHK